MCLYIVFGSTGLHMVLRGKVTPLTEPHIFTALNTTDSDLRSPTPVLESSDTVVSVRLSFILKTLRINFIKYGKFV